LAQRRIEANEIKVNCKLHSQWEQWGLRYTFANQFAQPNELEAIHAEVINASPRVGAFNDGIDYFQSPLCSLSRRKVADRIFSDCESQNRKGEINLHDQHDHTDRKTAPPSSYSSVGVVHDADKSSSKEWLKWMAKVENDLRTAAGRNLIPTFSFLSKFSDAKKYTRRKFDFYANA
jgi:hypothetical protein